MAPSNANGPIQQSNKPPNKSTHNPVFSYLFNCPQFHTYIMVRPNANANPKARAFNYGPHLLDPQHKKYGTLEGTVYRNFHAKAVKFMEDNELSRARAEPAFTTTKTGTDASKSGTAKRYGATWAMILEFALKFDDVQTAILFDRKICPDYPLPPNPELIMIFASYMHTRPGTQVLHPTTNLRIPLPQVPGNPIRYLTGKGTWNAPECLEKLQSSLQALFGLYDDLRTMYSDVCPACVHATEANAARQVYTGCIRHVGLPRVRSFGNVLQDPRVVAHFLKIRTLMQLHKRKGNIQLTPAEVRELRAHLLTQGLQGLQTYTMILFGIQLFLRADEILSFTFEQFLLKLQMLSEDEGIRGLGVQIKGKCDPDWVKLLILDDQEYPEFCLIRHLMIYIEKAGLKSGLLFPDLEKGLSDDGHNDIGITYPHFLVIMKFLVVTILGKCNENCTFGTHMLRKTAYLFAIWGVLYRQLSNVGDPQITAVLMGAIMQSARHASFKNAKHYALDAMSAFSWQQRGPQRAMNMVSLPRFLYLFVPVCDLTYHVLSL